MNYLKSLFVKLNPSLQVPEEDFPSFLKNQDQDIRGEFLQSLTETDEQWTELVEIVSDPGTRSQIKDLFDTEELFWAFLRQKVSSRWNTSKWINLIESFLKYNEGELLIETGFFDNGLLGLEEKAPQRLTQFILSKPDYFTWQYLSDAFIEHHAASVQLDFYGLREHFASQVVPRSSGKELFSYFAQSEIKKLPELSSEQKIELVRTYFQKSMSENKWALEEQNPELNGEVAQLFSQVSTYLSREELLEFRAFILDKAYGTKHEAKMAEKISQEFSYDEVKSFYESKTEIDMDFSRKSRSKIAKRKIPKALQEIFSEIEREKEVAQVMAGNYEVVTSLSYYKARQLNFEQKKNIALAYWKNSESYPVFEVSRFIPDKDKKAFLAEILLVNKEWAQDFASHNYSDLKLSGEKALDLLGVEETLSHAKTKEIVSLLKKEKITLEAIAAKKFSQYHYMDDELVAALAKENLITTEVWDQILSHKIDEAWVQYIPENKLAKLLKKDNDLFKMLAHPDLTEKQRTQIITNISRYDIPKALNLELSSEELELIYDKVKEVSLRDSKEILVKLLSKDKLPGSSKQDILNKLLKATDASTVLMPYLHLIDEKNKTKLITASLKSESGVMEILNNESSPDLRKRALRALMKFDTKLKSFINSKPSPDDLAVIKDLVIEKDLNRAASLLLRIPFSGKIDLIKHFEKKIWDYDLTRRDHQLLNAKELLAMSPYLSHYELEQIANNLSVELKEEISHEDSPFSLILWTASQGDIPDTLVKYISKENDHFIFNRLNPGQRFKVLKEVIKHEEDESFNRNFSKTFTKEEWAAVILGRKANWYAFSDFLMETDNLSVAWVEEQFNSIFLNDDLRSSFVKELDEPFLNKFKKKFPSVESLNEQAKKVFKTATLEALNFSELLQNTSSIFEVKEILAGRTYIHLNESDNKLLDVLIVEKPAVVIPLLKEYVNNHELYLSNLQSLAPYFKEYELEEYLRYPFKVKIDRMNEETPAFLPVHLWSEESRQEIQEKLLSSDGLSKKPTWIFDFIDSSAPSLLSVINKPAIMNYLLTSYRAKEVENSLKEILTSKESKINANRVVSAQLSYQAEQGPYFDFILHFSAINNPEIFNISANDNGFEIKLGFLNVYKSANGEKQASLLAEAEEKALLVYFKRLINLPVDVPGYYDTSAGRFIPDLSIPAKYLERAKISEDSKLSEGQLQELMFHGVELRLPARAIKSLALNSKEERYYEIKVELQAKFEAPSNEELQNLLAKNQGIFSQLDNLEAQLPVSERRFGFELEFSSSKPRTKLGAEFSKEFAVEVSNHYRSSDGKNWDFKQDGSLNSVNGGFTIEIASPILQGEAGITEAKKFLDKLFVDTKVSVGEASNSGMHVHHEVKDIISKEEQIAGLLSMFAVYQEPLFALCSSYRQDNEYCSKIYSSDYSKGKNFNHRDGFNFTTKGTLEFRMRESLDNTPEIIRWIKLTQRVVEDVAAKIKGEVDNFKEQVSNTINLLEQEKLRQVRSSNSLDALEQFLSAKEYSKILLSAKNEA